MKLRKIKYPFVGFLLSTLSIFLFLSLITFNYKDNSLFYFSSGNNLSTNFFGSFGAYIASMLFYLFSYSFYIEVIFGFYMSYLCFKKEKFIKNLDNVFYFQMLFLSSSLFLQVNFAQGGLLGFYLNNLLKSIFDSFLIKFVAIIFVMISMLLVTNCSLVSVAKFFVKFLNLLSFAYAKFKPVLKYAYNFACKVTSILKFLYKWFAVLLSEKFFSNGDPEYLYEQQDFWQPYQQEEQPNLVNKKEVLNSDVDINVKNESVVIKKEMIDKISYKLPNLEIFTAIKEVDEDKRIYEDLQKRAKILEDKLEKFGVYGKVKTIEYGPVVTLFEYSPNVDTKISKIIALEDDLALALEALSIRIIAPIPGKPYVGFEVANKAPRTVHFSNIVHSKEFNKFSGELPLILGQDSIGRNVVVDLFKMPHLLVAGSTGSGKSVALNAMLASLLCKHSPDQLKLVLIDPKRLEFAGYQDIAHLLFPIVTLPKKAVDVLKWLVNTMEQRYEFMAKKGVKNINDYHLMYDPEKTDMPFIVLVIDELADLMMTTGKDVEILIARIAQMARAAGIHMIVATQRPSVDVITGLIKVNFPSRISFRVVSKIDSRTILDSVGSEKLLGRGDMLFLNSNSSSLERVHGAYIPNKEINNLVEYIKSERAPNYIELNILNAAVNSDDIDDEMFYEIVDFLKEIDEVSISFLQRKFRIGYNRSARIMEQLEDLGYILPADGSKMRKVIKDAEMK